MTITATQEGDRRGEPAASVLIAILPSVGEIYFPTPPQGLSFGSMPLM